MSSNEGDVVFDPFAGCGTAIYAAHLNKRKWIDCDIAILSVRLVRDVLAKRYGLQEGRDYEVSGVPVSLEGAKDLFDRDPRQFQHWVIELSGGFCNKAHSGDRGIDGRIYFETAKGGLRSMARSERDRFAARSESAMLSLYAAGSNLSSLFWKTSRDSADKSPGSKSRTLARDVQLLRLNELPARLCCSVKEPATG